jgi:hypothetical protein
MFTLPFDALPGKKFSYCSGNFYLLAEILQRTTKMTCHDFAKKYLFDPLNFNQSYWLANYKNVNQGWGDLHIHPYDLAKIGSLLLNNGKWNDKQIISNEWLEKIKPLYYIHGTESYGYGWWLDSENPDEIQAMGRGGQRLFILREKKMVMVATGGGFDAGDIDDYALESIKTFNKNKKYNDQLPDLVKAAGSQDIATPAIKNKFSLNELNKSFQLNKNDLGLKTIRFEQRNEDDYIILGFTDDSKEEHPIGRNNQYKISNETTFGLPMAVKGGWINDTTLEINYNRLCRIENFKLRITFKGNSIELTITESTKKINETLIGKAL